MKYNTKTRYRSDFTDKDLYYVAHDATTLVLRDEDGVLHTVPSATTPLSMMKEPLSKRLTDFENNWQSTSPMSRGTVCLKRALAKYHLAITDDTGDK